MADRNRNRWQELSAQIEGCHRCPRLCDYCHQIGVDKRRAYRDQEYWARPVPNFGPTDARLLVVGLAPGAHGANRTGRMFTGDRSGDWLYRALHRAGFSSQAKSTARDDGLELWDCAITAVCHCAPPQNRPNAAEIQHCRDWFDNTVDLLPLRVLLALGRTAWQATCQAARRRKWIFDSAPRFRHGAEAALAGGRWMMASYHPSQQNTFTGRLTEPMLDSVMQRARQLLARASDLE